MGRPIAYGQAYGGRLVVPVPAAQSQPWQAEGGKFVHLNSSRHAVLSSGSVTRDLFGWAEVGTYSASSTLGQDIIGVNCAFDAVYEMPINATQTESQLIKLVGKVCDIETSSGIQYVNYDSSNDDVVQIVGYKYYNSSSGGQSLLVRLINGSITYTGV